MKDLCRIALTTTLVFLVACSEPPPPRSVSQFLEKPFLLEAALVRCTHNRAESRYDAECINAREAVKIIEAKKEESRRADLDEQSQRKRDALRRTQRAAAVARQRAAEARRLRDEAEYLAQFGQLPPSEHVTDEEMTGNVPLAVVPETTNDDLNASGVAGSLPTTGSNAPVAEIVPEVAPPTDLESVRNELRRRNDEGNEQ